jgi:hypothetical protein
VISFLLNVLFGGGITANPNDPIFKEVMQTFLSIAALAHVRLLGDKMTAFISSAPRVVTTATVTR